MKKQIILCCCLFFTTSALVAQIVYSPNQYIEYHVGTVPIIISAPHGGLTTPANIPDRTCNNPTLVTDGKMRELARATDSSFHAKTGCRLHLIMCNLKRTKLDCNRDLADGACGNADAEIAWTAFQHYIDSARQLAETNFPESFYIDLHGHGHSKQRLELGYLLWGSRLRNSDSTLNTPQFVGYSSIQDMVSSNVNNYTHAELLHGPYAFGTLLTNAGYPSVPSQQDIHPDTTDSYFSGGHNTRIHTCATPNVSSNGLQIETNYTGVRDNPANIQKFGDSLSNVLIVYLKHHFNMDLSLCAPAATNQIHKKEIEIFPTVLSAGAFVHIKKSTANWQYLIYDLRGKIVQRGEANSKFQLSNNLMPASYFIKLVSSEGSFHSKIIVQ